MSETPIGSDHPIARKFQNAPGHEEAWMYLHLALGSLRKLTAHLEGLDEALHKQTADLFEDAWGLSYVVKRCAESLDCLLFHTPGLSERIARKFEANGEPVPDVLGYTVVEERRLWG